MAWEIFGLQIGRRSDSPTIDISKTSDKGLPSFVAPNLEDGSASIESAPSGFYASYLDLDGTIRDDMDQIRQYRTMALHSEIESAVDDIINEAIVTEEGTPTVKLILDDLDISARLKDLIRDEFNQILRMLDFNNRGYELFRRWYVDGKIYFHTIIDPDNISKGVQELRYVDSLNIRKIQEVQKTKKPGTQIDIITGVKEFFIYTPDNMMGANTTASGIKLSPDVIAFIHSGLYDSTRKLIISYLHKAIKPLNQLRMIEDAVVIYRISRAPERRIFYIDIGSLPKMKAEEYMKSLMNKYRNKLVYDANTGELKDEKRHMSMLEDYWLPRREGGKGTEITTLPAGQNLGEMQDVEYFKKKLYRSLNVPSSRLEASNGFNMGRSSEISRDELKFSKFVSKLRSKFNGLFLQILRKQLVLKKIIREDEWDDMVFNMRLDYLRDSHFTELKNAEIAASRLDTLEKSMPFIGKFFSVEYVRKNILMQPEQDIKWMDKQIDKEKQAGIISGDSDTNSVSNRINTLETLDKYIGKYYSLGYIRRNILQQSPEEIERMDIEIKDEMAAGVKPAPNVDILRALGGVKVFGAGFDTLPADQQAQIQQGLNSVGSTLDPTKSATAKDPNDPNAVAPAKPKPVPVKESVDYIPTNFDNAAVMENLLVIVKQVQSGALPKQTGVAMVSLAFPSLPKYSIDAIFDPILVTGGQS